MITTLGKIDWNAFFFGSEDASFLLETVLRTFIMFAVILIGLTILGKRGVRQLSVFELVVIIGLGSAAGDPMFYKDVGVFPAIVVFVIVIGSYITVTHFTAQNKKFERMLEGKPVYLIEEGSFAIENFRKEKLAQDEFFAELRMKGVSHLGQVQLAIIETNGAVSVFYYPDNEVKPGLPVLPHLFEKKLYKLEKPGRYACTHCAATRQVEIPGSYTCPACRKDSWVEAIDSTRQV